MAIQHLEPPLLEAGSGLSLTKRDLLNIIFKRKYVVLALWLGVSLLVAAALLHLPPVYVANAKVLVKIEQQGRPSFLSGIAAYSEAPDTEPANRKLETEMEILVSRVLVEEVIRDLQLQPADLYRPPYVHLLAPVGRLIDWVKVDVMGLPPKPPRDLEIATEAFIKSLKVAPAKSKGGEATPNLITIEFRAANAGTAHQALARLMLRYQHFSNELDQRNGERVHKIVKDRLGDADRQVAEAQERLKAFNATVQPRGVVVQDVARAASPRNGGSDSPLRNRVEQLEIELAEQRQIYTDNVESVALIKENLASAKARLAAETSSAADSSDLALTLQRNLRLAEDHYLDLKRKLTQIDLFLEMNPNQVSSRVLVEAPQPPESSEWKKSVVMGIAASVAGLLLGLGMASLLEYADRRFSNPRDVERHTGLPLLLIVDQLEGNALSTLTGVSDRGHRDQRR